MGYVPRYYTNELASLLKSGNSYSAMIQKLNFESEFNDGEILRCFGILANMNFILVSEYGCNGAEPKIVLYKENKK